MPFRNYFVLFFSFILVSCSFNTDDSENKKSLKIQDSSSNLKCINKDVVSFFDGGLEKTDESKVHKAFDCMVYAVEVIDSHINIKNKDDIKKSSVKNLVKKKVSSYSEKTDKIIDVFFELKVKVLKGKPDKISHAELAKLKIFVEDLKSLYLNLFPTLQLLSKEKEATAPLWQVSSALTKLMFAEKNFSKIFSKYSLVVSKSEIESWLSISDLLEDQDRLDKWELYWSFHDLMWPNFKDVTYENVLYWLHGIRSVITFNVRSRFSWTMTKYLAGAPNKDLFMAVDDFLLLVERSLSQRKHHTIEYKKINEFIALIEKVYGLPRGLTSERLSEMVPIFVEKFVGVPRGIRTQPYYIKSVFAKDFRPFYKGFNQRHFENLMKEYDIYKNIQINISNKKISKSSTYYGLYSEHLTDFTKLVNNIGPFFPKVVNGKSTGLYIKESNLENKFNPRNLSMINMFRTLLRAIAMGYTSNSGRKNIYEGIRNSELTHFIADFEEFFGQIYIMEKRGSAQATANRMYMEAKLFVSSGDGIKTKVIDGVRESSLVKFTEAAEIIGHYSSSMFMIPNIYKEMVSLCGSLPDIIVFEKESLTVECFNKHFLTLFSKEARNLPLLKEYIDKYLAEQSEKEEDDETKYQLEGHLLYAGRELKNIDNTYLTYADLSVIGTLLYFVESVFLKFDTNKDNFIKESEVDKTYLYFRDLIEAKGHAECSGVAFRYILIHKSTPEVGWNKWKGYTPRNLGLKSKCFGKKYSIWSEKKPISKWFGSVKNKITGLFKDDKVVDENEKVNLELQKIAQEEILKAATENKAKDNKPLIDNKDISVDRQDILQIITEIKKMGFE